MKKWGTLVLVPLLMANPALARDAAAPEVEQRCNRVAVPNGSQAADASNLTARKTKKCRSGVFWLGGAAALGAVGGIIAATDGGKPKSP